MQSISRFLGRAFRTTFLTFFVCFWLVVIASLLSSLFGPERGLDPLAHQQTDSSYLAMFPDPYATDNTDSVPHMVHHRVWKAFSMHKYEADFAVSLSHADSARLNREYARKRINGNNPFVRFLLKDGNLSPKDPYAYYWTFLYTHLLQYDKEQLPDVYTAMDSLYVRYAHDRRIFANILVSFVQDIPYQLVHEGTCADIPLQDTACLSFRCQYHLAGKPCKPEIKFGVHSPVEFMYSLAGDCDTRTLLLQLLFYRYGYDSRILISEHYGHAMIGLRMPSEGDNYIVVNGFKYFMWETTNQGWPLGHISPQYHDLTQWTALYTPIDSLNQAPSPVLPSLISPET